MSFVFRRQQARRIGKIRATEVYVNFFVCRQQTHKRAAQQIAVGCADVTSEMVTDVTLKFLRLRQHIRKGGLFGFIKAVVGNTGHIKIWLQQREHIPQICFLVAEGIG